MKTLADFKRRCQVGTKIKTIHHQAFSIRKTTGEYLFKDEQLDDGIISKVQSNGFYIKRGGRDSFAEYPSAKQIKILSDDSIMILSENWVERTDDLIPLLTYTFIGDSDEKS